MKMRCMRSVIVLVLTLASLSVNGQQAPSPSSTPCVTKVLNYCGGNLNTTAGLTKCCQGLSILATDDVDCLCFFFKNGNITKRDALLLLNGCGVKTSTNPCPDLADPPAESPPVSYAPPPPPPPTKTFYNRNPPPQLLSPAPLAATPPQKDPKPTAVGVIVAAVVGSLAFVILLTAGLIFAFLLRRKRNVPDRTPIIGCEIPNPPPYVPSPLPDIYIGSFSHSFTYQALVDATDGFSKQNLIGEGGFGFVYKGVLQNGTKVAVKKLRPGSHQGDREFRAEVDIISRVHHKHLVSLVGYCITEDQKLLVYEYIPNKTLEFHLQETETAVLDWSARLKIAIGSAKGLAYLHEDCHPKIIHRDIKTPNILIDDNYDAKVADFGLAKFNVDNNSHISTTIVGTLGYIAPEYASTGQVTDKSDVYSFGVVLIELITGFKPLDKARVAEHGSVVAWATPLLLRAVEDGVYDDLVDQRLQDNYDTDEMSRVVSCAIACIRHTAKLRPTMSKVARILEGQVSVKDLNQGMKPGRSSSTESSDYGSDHAVLRKKFPKGTHTSAEYTSSEYSAVTNESITTSRVIRNEEAQ